MMTRRISRWHVFLIAACLDAACTSTNQPEKSTDAASAGGQGGDAGAGSGGVVVEGGTAGTVSDEVAGGAAGESAAGGASMGGGAGVDGEGGAVGAPGGQGGGEPPRTACAALVCEDFESGAWGPDWTPTASGAAVVQGMAAEGQYALRFTAGKRWIGSTLRYKKTLAHAGPLHGRFYMRLSRPHEWGTTFIFQTSANPTVEFGGKSGTWHITPLDTRERFGTFPSGDWVCVQWHITENPVTLTVEAEGRAVGSVSVPGSTTMPNYQPIRIGMHTYHPEDIDEGFEFFIDDIVIDKTPVPCR